MRAAIDAQLQAIADGRCEVRRRVARARRFGGYGWFTALLHNGHGHYGEALAAARQACEHEDVIYYGWALVELIEAAVRSGQPDEAAAALEPPERTHAGERHRLGARDRSALPWRC